MSPGTFRTVRIKLQNRTLNLFYPELNYWHELQSILIMGRKPFIYDPTLPLNISDRCTNKEWFEIPMENVWEIMSDYLSFMVRFHKATIHSFVLMSNHYHLIATFPSCNMSEAMRYFNCETSKAIGYESNRINQIYGNRYHKTSITAYSHFECAYKYNYRNPVEAGICKSVLDYRYSTLHGLLGRSRLSFPVAKDTLLFDNVVDTLKWLDTEPEREHYIEVGRALRKQVFKLNSNDRKPSFLDKKRY